MSSFIRKKRVTDLLNDQARARLVGGHYRNLNSCDQLSGEGESPSLSYLVHGFLEEDTCVCSEDSVFDDSDCDRVDSVDDSSDSVSDSSSVAISPSITTDPYRNLLIAHVTEGAEKFAFLREQNAILYRRNVAAFLRERRHDAAVCETAGDASGGSHEFIDVVQPGAATWRYFVDLDFRAQFEVARPTRQFAEVMNTVPGIFVGRAEELKRTVSTLCDALRRCFRSRGLPVPPWRKNRFMQNKWFGPCRRTMDPVRLAVNGVSCKLVGFNDVVLEAGRVVRTR
ncbi:unnamed protein product [Sphenostylis stenocarpa]|uniref:Uncharacterized protein n=1 Tax=Sphenostylis stenocarpa TaxID=92480 RepID=A0AA86VWE7_9FABA|nr:unnamed protein product [Sphenostylis stenocarpa]